MSAKHFAFLLGILLIARGQNFSDNSSSDSSVSSSDNTPVSTGSLQDDTMNSIDVQGGEDVSYEISLSASKNYHFSFTWETKNSDDSSLTVLLKIGSSFSEEIALSGFFGHIYTKAGSTSGTITISGDEDGTLYVYYTQSDVVAVAAYETVVSGSLTLETQSLGVLIYNTNSVDFRAFSVLVNTCEAEESLMVQSMESSSMSPTVSSVTGFTDPQTPLQGNQCISQTFWSIRCLNAILAKQTKRHWTRASAKTTTNLLLWKTPTLEVSLLFMLVLFLLIALLTNGHFDFGFLWSSLIVAYKSDEEPVFATLHSSILSQDRWIDISLDDNGDVMFTASVNDDMELTYFIQR